MLFANFVNAVECLCGECHHKERKHEAVTVGKPVGKLTAMPEHINLTNPHGYAKHGNYRRRRYSVAPSDFLHKEIAGEHEQNDCSAVDKGQTRHSYGVVGQREHLIQHFYKLEICVNRAVIRLGEIELAVGKRIVHGNKHVAGNHSRYDCNARKQCSSLEKQERKSLLMGSGKVIKEINCRENGNHKAYIKAGNECVNKRYDKHDEFSVINKLFNSVNHDRQYHYAVKPHGVHGLHHCVGAERIA